MASAPANSEPDPYEVVDPRVVANLLERMATQRVLLNAALPGGGTLLSAVLHVDAAKKFIVLDATQDPAAERLALGQPELRFTGRVDRVDSRFVTGPLQRVAWEGYSAYRAPLPKSLRYMQRREYFRVDIPYGHHAVCQLLVGADENSPSRELRARVYDISAGGLSLLIPQGEEGVLALGTRFNTCRLTLPESNPAIVSVRVRRKFRSAGRGGQSCAGCEFVDLMPAAENIIQRYLMRLERERVARSRE